MGLLDNNLVRLSLDKGGKTNAQVIAGTLSSYNNLSFQYAVITIKASSSEPFELHFNYENNGVYPVIPVFDEQGRVLYGIKKSGTYYISIAGHSSVNFISLRAVSGLTITYSLKEVSIRPAQIDLRPVQTIISDVATLSAGDTEKRIALNSTEMSFLLPLFKFFQVNAVYKNSSNANVYKTTFKVSKFDFMDNGYNMWAEELVSVSNRYAVQTDWRKVVANAMTIIFNFNAASEGDLLYYEVKGIR